MAAPLSLCVVTATTDPERAASCVDSWGDVDLVTVINGGTTRLPGRGIMHTVSGYLGTVPAFAKGVEIALEEGYDVIACLHDDLELHDPDWAKKVTRHFAEHPACGLLGFGGAIGLGAEDIYRTPYDPMQLARVGFRSNLVDAEVHGVRSLMNERVACLDGFSQIGRREFWEGKGRAVSGRDLELPVLNELQEAGMIHHAYDSALGVIADILGWEVWYLPIRCRHYGGRTAVGDQGYQRWANERTSGGDHGFWEAAHKILYNLGKGTLPIRV